MQIKKHLPLTMSGLILLLMGNLLWANGLQAKCPFDASKLTAKMPRSQVETLVAAWLKTDYQYNLYGNNLRGGKVNYQNNTCTLTITYASGMPAFWSPTTKSGILEHHPPMDETVLNFEITQQNK